jgi:flavin-dependent thymidylate synthase
MNCQTRTDIHITCGHSITQHAGDESGIGGPEPCMISGCPCEDFTRELDWDDAQPGEEAITKMVDSAMAEQRCPTCTAPSKALMPAVQHGGEVSLCYDPWHYLGLDSCPMCRSRIQLPAGNCAHTWHNPETAVAAFRAKPPSKTVVKWADSAMFTAEPIDADEGPKVYLLSMTPDPLAAIAAACKMYKGEVARSYRDVTHKERQDFVQQVLKTKLQAPFEFVKFHFLIEGVTRAFTHQMVRQRTAVYAQESLRFAVKEGGVRTGSDPVAVPPYLAGTVSLAEWAQQMSNEDGSPKGSEYMERNTSELQIVRNEWDSEVGRTMNVYGSMIEAGMPAEDARGLLPHNTLTRLHYSTDLRALLDHAGNRLCTQAQFEWRLVFAKIAEAIRNYRPEFTTQVSTRNVARVKDESDAWQYELLADLFRPVCYATGKCEFMADFDRACNIRNRVQANHQTGRDSSQWAEELDTVQGNPLVAGVGPESVVIDDEGRPVFIGAIRPAEWLLDPGAAR